ncbi:S-layer homology domain-containing protein [Fusibacter sp. JL298sf-3]
MLLVLTLLLSTTTPMVAMAVTTSEEIIETGTPPVPEDAVEGEGTAVPPTEGDTVPEGVVEGEDTAVPPTEGDMAPEDAVEGEGTSVPPTEGDTAPEDAVEGEDTSVPPTEGDTAPEDAVEGEAVDRVSEPSKVINELGRMTDTPVAEQFNLPLGETYYFDLSGETGDVGSINMGYPGSLASIPDTSLHYVPFTYAGTIEAYSLDSSSNGIVTTEEMANSNQALRSLFLSDYNVSLSHTTSWNDLNASDLIFGKDFDTHYTLRSLSVGNGSGNGGVPANNEWDQLLAKESAFIKKWSNVYSWGQDTDAHFEDFRAHRGHSVAADWNTGNATTHYYLIGWRPALEVLNAGSLGSDGLKAVTLDLNGGSFVSERDTIGAVVTTVNTVNIVCAGDSFTATSNVGLTRPNGNTDTYFKWNTKADGSGTYYDVGESVPSTVTTLYAQWAPPQTHAITVVNGSSDKPVAEAGATITLTADSPASGQVFDQWTSADGVTFADKTATSTTFTMPAKAVTVHATYKEAPPQTHAITVVNGSSDKPVAEAGATITLTADPPASGQVFDQWTSADGVTFADKTATSTTFTMPAKAVMVHATYTGEGTGNGTGDGDLAVDPPETFPEGDEASRVEAGDGGTLAPVLNNRPYIVGMPDGTFQPDKLLTRAEIVVMFDRFYQLEEDYEVLETYNCYSDVTPSAWYADAVNRMTQHGLVKGYLDGTFKPHATITREELAQIIYNQLDIDACYERERVDPMDTYMYNDINGLWSTRAIVGLQSRGLLNDLAQKRFNPTKPVTRAETVVVLNRYFKYDGASGDVIDFKDIPQDSELAPAVAMAHKGNIVYSPFIEDLVQCDDCN